MHRRFFFIVALTTLAMCVVQSTAQPVPVEKVIREVCTKSDSVAGMHETVIRSKEMIREKWSAVYPTFSTSLFAGRSLGSGMQSASTSAGRNSGADDSPLNRSYSYGDQNDLINQINAMIAEMFKPKQSQVYSASLQVTQPIYTFGKVGTAIDIAVQFDSSVAYSIRRNLQQLQLSALDAFFQVSLLQTYVTVLNHSLARKKEVYDFMNRNFQLGSGSKAQILAALADVKSQESEIINKTQSARSSLMYLCSLMGRDRTDTLMLDSMISLPLVQQLSLRQSGDQAVQSALSQRYDLRSLDFLIQATEGGAKIFKAMYLPNIAAQASFGTGGTHIKEVFDWDKKNWLIGVGLQATLFDGFAHSAQSAQYQSDARKLQIMRHSAGHMIEIEVLTAMAEIAAADGNKTASQELLAAAREAYELTHENFKSGSGQFFELQSSEERLRLAEMENKNAYYRLLRSKAAFLIAMGNDIVSMEEK
ncbi:MAG: TolC family protein [Chitinivibrionales bacterium]|nr:TolC family protein [Chitinivibrionales bacterium]